MEKHPRFDTFGERFSYWRLLRGFKTQKAFAKRLNIKQPSISSLESGNTKEPSAPVLLHAADALRLNPWYLLTGEGPAESFAYATLTQGEQQLIVVLRALGEEALQDHLDAANAEYAKLAFSQPSKPNKGHG